MSGLEMDFFNEDNKEKQLKESLEASNKALVEMNKKTNKLMKINFVCLGVIAVMAVVLAINGTDKPVKNIQNDGLYKGGFFTLDNTVSKINVVRKMTEKDLELTLKKVDDVENFYIETLNKDYLICEFGRANKTGCSTKEIRNDIIEDWRIRAHYFSEVRKVIKANYLIIKNGNVSGFQDVLKANGQRDEGDGLSELVNWFTADVNTEKNKFIGKIDTDISKRASQHYIGDTAGIEKYVADNINSRKTLPINK